VFFEESLWKLPWYPANPGEPFEEQLAFVLKIGMITKTK